MRNYFLILFAFFLTSCAEVQTTKQGCGSEAALSTCLSPVQTPDYYIEQGVKYFRTMESTVPINVRPNYSDLVIRWEWHPWLLLTGYKRKGLVDTDIWLKLNPTSYDTIDCKYFDKNPFCRCHVIFNYSGEPCPIYEEFTFNNQGEITFIEAWSDYPSLIPMDKTDYWAEGENVNRLSTKVPGLGNETGRIDPDAQWMIQAAADDSDLADLLMRLKNPIGTYLNELLTHSEEVAHGCEKPEGDEFPYWP